MKSKNWETGNSSPSKHAAACRTISLFPSVLVSVPSLLIILPL